MIRQLLSLCLAACIAPAHALSDKSFAHGIYWGDEPAKEVEKQPKPKAEHITVAPYREINKAIGEKLEELKARAILEPTIDNVTTYIELQNKVVNMSTKFGEVWQDAMLMHPELNYEATHPRSNFALTEKARLKKVSTEKSLIAASKRFGLVYVYRGHDPMSKLEVPILARISQKYGFTALGVSLDGVFIEGLKSTNNLGQVERLGLKITPALLGLNVRTRQVTPLHYGLIAETELEEKMSRLLTGGS